MDFEKLCAERYSLRKFSDRPVEAEKLEKVLENPQVINTPVVRNGKQATLGYQPDVWKGLN